MGFFGIYAVSLSIIPGLPAIELSQFYILLAFLKVVKKKPNYPIFYSPIISIVGIYVLFLILIGLFFGLSGELNVYLRVFKLTFPLLLFYIVPRLLKKENDYSRFFAFIFPIVILAFITQLFDIVVGQSFTSFVGAEQYNKIDIIDGKTYRGFYNLQIVLIGFFGALYYLVKRDGKFNVLIIYTVVFSSLSMAFLSATRGWMIAFSLILILYSFFTLRSNPLRLLFFSLIIAIGFIFGRTIPVVDYQINYAFERLGTVGGMIEGDEEAKKTEMRTTLRGPRVMSKWNESKLFGWGFSDEFFKFQDGHVGNQNILLHSGLLGYFLFIVFLCFFLLKLSLQSIFFKVYKENLVFFVFLLGWFFIHSTSGQHFAFYGLPNDIIAKAVFFSFGAFSYNNIRIKIIKQT